MLLSQVIFFFSFFLSYTISTNKDVNGFHMAYPAYN